MARGIDDVRARLLDRATRRVNPASFVPAAHLARIMDDLRSCDRDAWGQVFIDAAAPVEDAAEAAEQAGDLDEAREKRLLAYDILHVGRYPAANSAVKAAAYRKARFNHDRAMRLIDPGFSRVDIPFDGRPGEGETIPALLRWPAGQADKPLPVLLTWAGIDAFKEERIVFAEPYLEGGFAVLAIDMPGTGESPITGSTDAERLWTYVFDWLATQPDLDASKVVVMGLSTGGYWATKIAHTHRDRIRGAINQGGCAHFAFEPAWIETSKDGDYPFELPETLASAWGLETEAEWVRYCPRLSLLDQEIITGDGAPMLLVNGVKDTVFPIEDMYLLLRHGRPKLARFYDAGHMGIYSHIVPLSLAWARQAVGMAAGPDDVPAGGW